MEDKATVVEVVQQVVNRPPSEYKVKRSRWDLESLVEILSPQLRIHSRSGMWQMLKRIGFSYRRARNYVHSPDPQYDEKRTYIELCIEKYDPQNPNKVVILCEDELTYYNHASISSAYCAAGTQPLAHTAVGGTKQTRIAGCMNLFTGQFTYIQRSRISISALVNLWKQVQKAYPEAETIYVIIDNWPIHYHPDVLDALVQQSSPFELKTPSRWQHIQPSGKYTQLELPIQLVPLPTYASWLNPIEKVWKWLKKELLHLHDYAHRFKELRPEVDKYLAQFEQINDELLQICGLKNQKGIYAQSIIKAQPQFFGG